jgi:chromosome segregation ATPase
MPSPAALMAKDLDHAVACARAVLPLADDITSAKSKLDALQSELTRTEAEVHRLREVFASEKSAWLEEWKKLREEGDLASGGRRLAEEELLAKLEEAKSELLRLQNAIASTSKRVEKIGAAFRKLDRMIAHPSSGAPGMPALLAEIAEATR